MLDSLDTWKLLAGLGIFLFGMFLLEESIRKLAGRSFKRFIRTYTTGKFRSILSGTAVTAVLQSSSAVSLMVLAFVGAGIMAMENAIGVILGSNVGTTATAWIVATIGFQLKIESFALPLIGLGGLGTIFFGKSERLSNISKLSVGFGFLFMGLDYMKTSVEGLTTNIDLASLPHYNIFVYLAIGLLLTAIMQSSSATIAIVLTSINAGILSFHEAGAMIIGANIGTTVTVLLAAIGGSVVKKRVAASHLVFNLVAAIVGMILLFPMSWMIEWIVGPRNAVMGVALFHTLFNVIGMLVFLPFIGYVAGLLSRFLPERSERLTRIIHQLDKAETEASVAGINKEVGHLILAVFQHNLKCIGLSPDLVIPPDPASAKPPIHDYEKLKQLQSEIFAFAASVQAEDITEESNKSLNRYLHAARMALYSAKTIRDSAHYFEAFQEADDSYLNKQYLDFQSRQKVIYGSLIDLMQETDTEEIAGKLTSTRHRNKKEDKAFVKSITLATSQKEISEGDISDLLIANRTLIQSNKQALQSIGELKMSEKEIELIERVSKAKEGLD